MVFEHSSYRTFLRAVLEERVRQNPRFSLRELARQWGFSPSSLSEAMNGKANLSAAAVRKVAEKLALSDREAAYLSLLAELERARGPEERERIQREIRAFRPSRRSAEPVELDRFLRVADWYHSPILELGLVEGATLSPEYVSRQLGISRGKAQAGLERLLRLGLLERSADGSLKRAGHRSEEALEPPTPSNNELAQRSFHRQMVERLAESGPDIGVQRSLAIDPNALPEVQGVVERCVREIAEICERYPKKRGVYQMMIHLFSLSPSSRRGS